MPSHYLVSNTVTVLFKTQTNSVDEGIVSEIPSSDDEILQAQLCLNRSCLAGYAQQHRGAAYARTRATAPCRGCLVWAQDGRNALIGISTVFSILIRVIARSTSSKQAAQRHKIYK